VTEPAHSQYTSGSDTGNDYELDFTPTSGTDTGLGKEHIVFMGILATLEMRFFGP
jgi:hypothetical protein